MYAIMDLIMDFFILQKAKICHCIENDHYNYHKMKIHPEEKFSEERAFFKKFYLLLGYPTVNFDPLMRGQP